MATAAPDYSRYAPLLDAQATKPLTREEEQAVTRRYRDTEDPEALRRLVETNQHFVILVSRQYQGMGLPLEDLISEGNVGLLQAAKRFDPNKGLKFITYAVWWIRRAILQALSDQSRLVRLPKYKIRQIRSLRERVDELRAELGREPLVSDIARATDLSPRKVEELLTLGSFELSMDIEPENGGDCSPFDEELSEDHVEDDYYRDEVCRIVREAIDSLSQRERHVILRRFGFIDKKQNTLAAVSGELGLTKERVRQIELQAKRRIEQWFRRRDGELQIVGSAPC